eukprot:8321133-Karenia_brevis.AAC.1
MSEKLRASGLLDLFPVEVCAEYFCKHVLFFLHSPAKAWPPAEAVNQLAGKLKRLEARGSHGRFIFVDLKK